MAQVVILGFPNVGKSTLFNRLLKEKKALIHSRPGMTRDSVSAVCTLGGRRFDLVDTGGIPDAHGEPLSEQVRETAWKAARKADVLLLVLDARRGLSPAEEDLYRSLKKTGKPIIVAVNKIDFETRPPDLSDFYRLGEKRLHLISAEHNLNVSELGEAITAALPGGGEAESRDETRPLRIAVVGRINVGKSSLVNRLCGEERFIVSELPGTTRDCSEVILRRGEKAYILVDTAGIRKLVKVSDERESAGVIKARKTIPLADVVCLVLDAAEFPTHQDAAIARLAFDSGKPLVIVVNKWDLVREEDIPVKEIKKHVFSRLEFISYAPLVTASALTGKRVTQIFDLAEKVYQAGQKRVSTPLLNKFLASVAGAGAPVSKSGRPLKIKYMTQAGILPPTFVLFTSARGSLSPAYEKHFIQKLRVAFDLWGTPIRVVLRSGRS